MMMWTGDKKLWTLMSSGVSDLATQRKMERSPINKHLSLR
jgi:hypothetical protein